jgi:hypothetical protein
MWSLSEPFSPSHICCQMPGLDAAWALHCGKCHRPLGLNTWHRVTRRCIAKLRCATGEMASLPDQMKG